MQLKVVLLYLSINNQLYQKIVSVLYSGLLLFSIFKIIISRNSSYVSESRLYEGGVSHHNRNPPCSRWWPDGEREWLGGFSCRMSHPPHDITVAGSLPRKRFTHLSWVHRSWRALMAISWRCIVASVLCCFGNANLWGTRSLYVCMVHSLIWPQNLNFDILFYMSDWYVL